MKPIWLLLIVLVCAVGACAPMPAPMPETSTPAHPATAMETTTVAIASSTVTRVPATPTTPASLPLAERLPPGQQLGVNWLKTNMDYSYYFERGHGLEPLIAGASNGRYDSLDIMDSSGQRLYSLDLSGWWANQGDAIYSADKNTTTTVVRKYSLGSGKLLWETPLDSAEEGGRFGGR